MPSPGSGRPSPAADTASVTERTAVPARSTFASACARYLLLGPRRLPVPRKRLVQRPPRSARGTACSPDARTKVVTSARRSHDAKRRRLVSVRPDEFTSPGSHSAETFCGTTRNISTALSMSLMVIRHCRPTFRPGSLPARNRAANHFSDTPPIRSAASVRSYVSGPLTANLRVR